MKKLFTEPEIEILNFLCSDTTAAPGSINEGEILPDDGAGEGEVILP